MGSMCVRSFTFMQSGPPLACPPLIQRRTPDLGRFDLPGSLPPTRSGFAPVPPEAAGAHDGALPNDVARPPGVVVLLPLMHRFTRLVEHILPERGSPLTRCLDSSALASPTVAVEAVRRTIARALAAVCGSTETALAAASRDVPARLKKDAISVPEAAYALRQAQVFLSDVTG